MLTESRQESDRMLESLLSLDREVFLNLDREELLSYRDGCDGSPTVKRSIAFLNQVNRLVADEILGEDDLARRVSVMEKWIFMANRCLERGSVNLCFMITATLNSAYLDRLKHTKGSLSRKAKRTLDQLRALVSFEGNYKALRAYCAAHPEAIVPSPRITSDLEFARVGNQNPTTRDTQLDRILDNVEKRQRRISRNEPSSVDTLQLQERLDAIGREQTSKKDREDSLYNRSYELEPRVLREVTNPAILGLNSRVLRDFILSADPEYAKTISSRIVRKINGKISSSSFFSDMASEVRTITSQSIRLDAGTVRNIKKELSQQEGFTIIDNPLCEGPESTRLPRSGGG